MHNEESAYGENGKYSSYRQPGGSEDSRLNIIVHACSGSMQRAVDGQIPQFDVADLLWMAGCCRMFHRSWRPVMTALCQSICDAHSNLTILRSVFRS